MADDFARIGLSGVAEEFRRKAAELIVAAARTRAASG
jgi:hypothetical protein